MGESKAVATKTRTNSAVNSGVSSIRIKLWVAMLSLALTIAAPVSSNAAQIITYTLNGVAFSDGTTATGQFSYNVTTSQLEPGVTVKIQSSPTDANFDQVYNANGSSVSGAVQHFDFIGNLHNFVLLDLAVSFPLTTSGSTSLLASSFLEDTSQTPPLVETITAGDLSIATSGLPVPEPSSAILLFIGFVGSLGILRWKRRIIAIA
jgi:hypothetical protein